MEDLKIESPPELNPPPCPLEVCSRAPGLPPPFQAPEPTPGDAMSSFGALPFWNTGGTGGTGDFGWGSQAMMHVMAEQARLAENYSSFPLDCGVEMGPPEAGMAEGCGVELGLAVFNVIGAEYALTEYNFSSWFPDVSGTPYPSRVPQRQISPGAPRNVLATLTIWPEGF
jgi:hypothetical protein